MKNYEMRESLERLGYQFASAEGGKAWLPSNATERAEWERSGSHDNPEADWRRTGERRPL